MKVSIYNSKKVISSEEFVNYIYADQVTQKNINCIKNYVSNHVDFVLGVDYFRLAFPESRMYGLNPKHNYPHGLNVFTMKGVQKVIDWDKGRILDYRKLLADIKRPSLKDVPVAKSKKQPVEKTVDKPATNNIGNPTVQMPFDQLFAMVDTQMEKQATFIKCLQESNERLVDEVSRLTGAVDSLMQVLTTTSVTIKSPQSESEILNVPALLESVFDVPLIIKEDTSYEEWKKAINHALDLIIRDGNGLTRSDILHDAYDRIRAQYGIVWEQEAKEFKNEFERGPVNTKELCWWMETRKPTYKNLLIGKLNTIYSEVKRGKAV